METRAPYALIGLFVLVVIGAVFGFVYWLNNTGGLTSRTAYRIRFENNVSGLLTGAAVLFNGIRVGEVTDLVLNPDDPRQVMATVAVTATTPLRADTKAGLEFQGLTGVPVVSLIGGAPGAPPLAPEKNGPPLIIANPNAGQSMTDAARQALLRLDTLLSDNSDNLKGAIANLNTFTGALARNSDRIDAIISGLERMTGVTPPKPPPAAFDLAAATMFGQLEKHSSVQLVVNDPTTEISLDSQKIAVAPDAGESPPLDDFRWSDSVPKLVQGKIIQSFENANSLGAVARPTEGLMPDYQLLIDIRTFEIEKSPTEPGKLIAHVALSAKLLGNDGKIVASRVLDTQAPATDTRAPDAVAALNNAFVQAATQLVEWAAGAI